MKWPYKVSFFLMLISWTFFLILAAYHTDTQFYSEGNLNAISTRGYSWIWYHPEQWTICLVLSLISIGFFIMGLVADIRKLAPKISDYIKLEINETIDEEEDDFD